MELTDLLISGRKLTMFHKGYVFRDFYLGYMDFDGANGGTWKKYINIPITEIPHETSIYEIVIDTTDVKVYDFHGNLKAQSSIASEFWSLVCSDGKDIRFFDQSFKQLYFFVKSFDYENKKSRMTVKLPKYSSELNIGFGNPYALESDYLSVSEGFGFLDNFETGSIDYDWWDIKKSRGSVGIQTDKVYEGSYAIGSSQGGYEGSGADVYDQNHYFVKIPVEYLEIGKSIKWTAYDRRWKTTTWPGHFCGYGIGGEDEIYNIPCDDTWHLHEVIITRQSETDWQFEIYEDGESKKTVTITKSFTDYFYFGIQTRHNGASDNSIYVRTDLVKILPPDCVETTPIEFDTPRILEL